ncbi:RIP metalloprotease RseP [Desulfurispora thermophila]|uniref:RIP metalloprotease RseP n=1 Tax=Desulfurispora thermophila TaxID=265470 RepID=UPI000362311E|nr:RIP metalloprotease RseP [Desulfurispora thermophila]
MQTFWASVIVFGLLIFFHELGHFAIAKLVGIKVQEFSLGFGPRLLGLKWGETAYNLRLLPLGGFVRMAGMDPEEDEDERGFNKKTVGQRVGVIFAGPLMNFLLAVGLLAVLFMVQGVPVPTTQVETVWPGRPAEKAGFVTGDRIVAVDGRIVQEWQDVSELISRRPGEQLAVRVERQGREITLLVTPEADERGRGKIGISPRQVQKSLSLPAACWMGVKYTLQVTGLIIIFIGHMITGQAPPDLGGPVRVVAEIGKAARMGVSHLVQLAAFLSINLGLFNLFPIPALDGSRIMFLLLEKLRGRPVDPRKENFIHLVGFGLLLLLIVVITYNDILQLM